MSFRRQPQSCLSKIKKNSEEMTSYFPHVISGISDRSKNRNNNVMSTSFESLKSAEEIGTSPADNSLVVDVDAGGSSESFYDDRLSGSVQDKDEEIYDDDDVSFNKEIDVREASDDRNDRKAIHSRSSMSGCTANVDRPREENHRAGKRKTHRMSDSKKLMNAPEENDLTHSKTPSICPYYSMPYNPQLSQLLPLLSSAHPFFKIFTQLQASAASNANSNPSIDGTVSGRQLPHLFHETSFRVPEKSTKYRTDDKPVQTVDSMSSFRNGDDIEFFRSILSHASSHGVQSFSHGQQQLTRSPESRHLSNVRSSCVMPTDRASNTISSCSARDLTHLSMSRLSSSPLSISGTTEQFGGNVLENESGATVTSGRKCGEDQGCDAMRRSITAQPCAAPAPLKTGKTDPASSDYFERRKKNNEAAKRSRDLRRMKEEGTAMKAAFLEQENIRLKAELQIWRAESAKLHHLIYNRI